MYYMPFAVGSLLFALTTSLTANVIIPNNLIIESLSGFTIFMNLCNFLVELWNRKHSTQNKDEKSQAMPEWSKYLRLGAVFLFMCSEIASVALMLTWMLWAVYAPEAYLLALMACLIILIIAVVASLELEHAKHPRHRHIINYIDAVVSVLALILIIVIIIRG